MTVSQKKYGKVVGIGYCCVDILVSWESADKTVRTSRIVDYDMQGGGMAATAMVAVARLGGKAEFLGTVGDDTMADLIINEFAKENVGTSRIVRMKSQSGPVIVVCVDAVNGDRHFKPVRSIPDPENILDVEAALKGAGCLLLDTVHHRSALHAAKTARAANIPVVGDVGWINDRTKELIPLIDYVIASQTCAEHLTGNADYVKALDAFRNMGAKTAVITLGNKGLIAHDGESVIEKQAFQVPVADTTGAGDTFHGAFAFGVVAGLSFSANLIFSSAVAAIKCRKLGGRAGIPSLDATLEFLSVNIGKEDFEEISGKFRY